MSIFKLCGAPGARLALSGVVLAAAVFPHPGVAQGEDADEEVREAEVGSEVELLEVTGRMQRGSEVAIDLEEFGNSVQIIDSVDIEAGGYVNMAEIAQGLIRGANVGYSPDEGEFTIRLDGGGDRDTLVTLDGVPLYDRGPGIEQIWGATYIDPRMIERIEVFRGGQSLYFGTNGGLGVVNIVSKEPDGTRKGEFGGVFGSFRTRELYGNVSFPISDDKTHSVMLYGSRYATDGHRIFNRDVFPDQMAAAGGIGDYSNSRDNIGAKYRWEIDANSELKANVQHTQVDFQDTFPNSTIYGDVTSRQILVNAAYSRDWSDRFSTDIDVSYREPELFHSKFAPIVCEREEGCEAADGEGDRVPQGFWTGGFEPLSDRGIGDGSVVGGFQELIATARNSFRFNRFYQAVVGLQSVNYRDNSDPEVNIDDSIVSTNGIFIDNRLTPFASTSISLAARIDFEDSFGSETIWKFGLRQRLGGGFYVRANGGTSYSLPRTNELFRQTENLVGNPDLETERTETYNAGVGISRTFGARQINAEVGGFHTDIDNRIRTTQGQLPNSYFNDDAVTEIRGLTADVDGDIGGGWRGSLSYTRQDATPDDSNQQINATPEWFVTGQLRWSSDSDRYHFALLPRYQGPEFIDGPNGLPDLNYGEYFLVNSTFGYWAGSNREHRFQFRLINVLDEDYGERGSFGTNQFDSAFIRGEYDQDDPEFRFPYVFQGKPRSVMLTYSYRY